MAVTSENRVSLPILRGSAEGAFCEACPFSVNGGPNRPVFSEFPEQPKWLLIGEGPGFNETRLNRPFIGMSGEVVMKLLARIGVAREEVYIGNATLCMPPSGSPDTERERAAQACQTRMRLELAKFPGVPILTLGAVAARSVIPKPALDAIDPPDVPESKQKRQKRRQRAEKDERDKHDKRLRKVENRILKELIIYQRKKIKAETRGRCDGKYLDRRISEVQAQLEAKAREHAIVELAQREEEKARRPKKKKPIKITDIVGTCFDVDVDGTGTRSVIPAIHPAALLRGGGRSIAGSHTPDLAYVNLTYDFGKVNALAEGKDIRLDLNIAYEGKDAERATQLFIEQLQAAFDEGELGVDLETFVDDPDRHHPLMAYVARIRAIGLATKHRSVSMLWDLIAPWAQSYFQALLVSERVTVVYHNALYDRTVLKANGFELKDGFADTLLAHHSAFPGCAHSLQTVTTQFFATTPWKSEFRLGDEDVDKLLVYNAKDTGATRALRSTVEIIVKRNKNERTYAIDRRMSECATRMHLHGMPVSREINTELLTTFSKNVAESRDAVESVARDPKLREQVWHYLAFEQAKLRRKKDLDDFQARYDSRLGKISDDEAKGKWRWKIGSGKHVAALIQALGVQLTQVTPSGNVSTKKEILENLVDVPIVRDLLTFRENDKLYSTFCWPIFDRFVDGLLIQTGFADENDRIHPLLSVHKISGRWASYEPVVHNVPKAKWKKQPDGTMKQVRPNLRRQIKVRKGRKLVGFDFCLAKGTLIDTPNGHLPIEDLAVGDLVFSYNHQTQRPDCSRISQRLFTGNRKTLKVILDNGEEVRCTPNHRWLICKYGEGRKVFEVEASELRPGTRLLPLRRSLSGPDRNYETLYSSSAFEYIKTHVAVAQAWLGPRPNGYHIHHRNENPLDNRPGNLEYKLKADHIRDHSSVNTTAQWADPKIRRKMSRGISASIAKRGGYGGENNPNWGNRSGEFGRCPNCGAETYYGGKHPKRFCSKACFYEFRRNNPRKHGEKYDDLNHKVVAVVEDGVVVPTYDIEVERDHNFALAAGVFVHNSQLEARNLALISGDEFLLDIFASGKDIHTECARVIFSGAGGTTPFDRLDPVVGKRVGKVDVVDPCEYCGRVDFHSEKCKQAKLKKQLRDLTKQVEYGTFYGGSPETVWKVLLKEGFNVKLADVTGAVQTLMRKMTGIVRWQRSAVAKASLPPYTIHDFVLGRRRVFPMGQVDPNEALNFESQATAAAIMDIGMDRMEQRIVDRSYKECFGIVQVHDAAAYECSEDDAEDVAADIKECFEQEYERNGHVVPYPVDVKIADSWDGV